MTKWHTELRLHMTNHIEFHKRAKYHFGIQYLNTQHPCIQHHSNLTANKNSNRITNKTNRLTDRKTSKLRNRGARQKI